MFSNANILMISSLNISFFDVGRRHCVTQQLSEELKLNLLFSWLIYVLHHINWVPEPAFCAYAFRLYNILTNPASNVMFLTVYGHSKLSQQTKFSLIVLKLFSAKMNMLFVFMHLGYLISLVTQLLISQSWLDRP